MKPFLIISVLVLTSFIVPAQSEKYQATMQKNMVLLDSAKTNDQLVPLVSAFERVGDAEKTIWLPYYYAALCQISIIRNSIQQGAAQKDATGVETMLNKAEVLIAKAELIDPSNSEIYVLKNMLVTNTIMMNPMVNGQKYGPLAATYLTKSIQLDSTNPRPFIMAGMSKYYTPEQWGGDKKKAMELFKKADMLDQKFNPASVLHPHWGRMLIDVMLNMTASSIK